MTNLDWSQGSAVLTALRKAWPEGSEPAITTPVVTDSRRVVPGAIFVAIKGDRFDGHDFVDTVREMGACCAVVDHQVKSKLPQVVVPDTRWAYSVLASWRRARFTGPVLAVVGSNGKTTSTQMLASILREALGDAFWGTKGNFNNDLGVSHTIFTARNSDRMGLVEAGMNHPGEMALLADMVRPEVVLVTNAQREHQEFLSSVEMTAYENGFMILGSQEHAKIALPADDDCIGIWEAMCVAARKEAWLYTTRPNGRGIVQGIWEDGKLRLETPFGRLAVRLRIAGEHNVHNATGAACAALAAGIKPDAVVRGLEAFEALPGRGARKTYGALMLIDDAYNANPDSVRASIAMTAREPGRKVFIFGRMGEIGTQSEACHREMGAWAKTCGIDELWTVGAEARYAAEVFGEGAKHFASVEALCEHLAELPKVGTVTVKASHSAGFDRIVRAIDEARRSVSES